ncbi:hypothetical protein Q73_00860 [Bacillus coahuilensis m2-6]|uniref:hypothetical protein n=1 Tax=Bacillus coahuilensis TaxID=408580 RepID=UPI0001850FFD|nr:hypothetical protein [Bacillus coahuilensis]KUP09822.1 hypothetical protein Q73_00860 [Bacillus coahuilensis m2-6]
MKLLNWKYTTRSQIKAYFSDYPHSLVIFRKIRRYYLVYEVKWSDVDPPVTKEALEKMEILLNKEFGYSTAYQQRKSRTP